MNSRNNLQFSLRLQKLEIGNWKFDRTAKFPISNFRFYILFIIFFQFTSLGIAQTGDWVWVKGAGGTLHDVSNSITTDLAGNVYVAGYYKSDTMDIGNIVLLNDSMSLPDIFIARYDASGNFIWAKRAGGTGSDIATSIVTDAVGNIYLTGTFNSSLIHFGNKTLSNTLAGSFDVFIAKYDSSGNVLWVKSTGGPNDDVANNIVIDRNSNIYLTGYFASDSIAFGNKVLRNSGANSSDIFSVKMDSAGNTLWAKSAGGTDEDEGYGICVDKNFNVYVTGHFLSYTVSFGTATLTNSYMNSDDIFIAKYDSSGSIIWVKKAGGINDDVSYGICADVQGNIYVTGVFFSPTISFDSISVNNVGGGDVFLAKYDSGGNVLWVKSGGGTDNDIGTSLTSDAGSNVYFTGYFKSTSFSFGADTLYNLGANSDDIFVIKLDSSGNMLWDISAGGNQDDWGLSINSDVSNNIYITGASYSSSINFGNMNLLHNHHDGRNTDIWLGKLDKVTGIMDENNFFSTLHLFPNPTLSQVTIDFAERGKIGNAEIEIYNTLGEKIKRVITGLDQMMTEARVSIDVSDLPQGLYFVRIHETTGERVGRFVKE